MAPPAAYHSAHSNTPCRFLKKRYHLPTHDTTSPSLHLQLDQVGARVCPPCAASTAR
ncbi:hypothetical protein M3J09_008060 [Ascochyta lentis]